MARCEKSINWVAARRNFCTLFFSVSEWRFLTCHSKVLTRTVISVGRAFVPVLISALTASESVSAALMSRPFGKARACRPVM